MKDIKKGSIETACISSKNFLCFCEISKNFCVAFWSSAAGDFTIFGNTKLPDLALNLTNESDGDSARSMSQTNFEEKKGRRR
jgi:hypothetical protein